MGPKRRRDPSEYNPLERNKIRRYYDEKKKRTGATNDPGEGTSRHGTRGSREISPNPTGADDEIDLGSDFSEEEGGGGQEMEGMERRGGGMGPGGGTGGNLNGVQETHTKPYGQKTQTRTKTYKKTFTVHMTNGQAELNWVENAGTTTASPSVTWNEGWNLIPWGFMHASMTPGEYVELATVAKQYRILNTSVLLEDMIPFQEVLTAGGETQTIATASNRPNIWWYKDKNRLLPKLNAATQTVSHSRDFQVPYINFTETRLPIPTWTLNNFQPSAATHRIGALPGADTPQGVWSLLNTGCVQQLNAGGKIADTWSNKDKSWKLMKLNWDQENITTPGGATALEFQQIRSTILTGKPTQHIGSRVQGTGQILTPTNTNAIVNHWADTHLALNEGGPPYLLAKVEPYFDSQDNNLNIFMKATLHYTMTIEYEENERFNTFAPFNLTGVRPSTTYAQFELQAKDHVAQFAAGNELQTAYGPDNSNSVWS